MNDPIFNMCVCDGDSMYVEGKEFHRHNDSNVFPRAISGLVGFVRLSRCFLYGMVAHLSLPGRLLLQSHLQVLFTLFNFAGLARARAHTHTHTHINDSKRVHEDAHARIVKPKGVNM